MIYGYMVYVSQIQSSAMVLIAGYDLLLWHIPVTFSRSGGTIVGYDL